MSIYNPHNRSNLLRSIIGQPIKEIRRYSIDLPDSIDDINFAETILKKGNLVSLHFFNDLVVDFSGYFPREVEVKRGLVSGKKMVVAPDRIQGRPYPMIVYQENSYIGSSINETTKNALNSFLNQPIIDISILSESENYKLQNRSSIQANYRGVIFHFSSSSFIIGLGLGETEYDFAFSDWTNVDHKMFYEETICEIKIPEVLNQYREIDKGRMTYWLEVNNLRDWSIGSLDELKKALTDSCKNILVKELRELQNILISSKVGILDLALKVDNTTGKVFIAEPFDVVFFEVSENQIFISSIIDLILV